MKTFFSLKDFDFNGKKVLVRADYNVPMDGTAIRDPKRIHATLPTIEYLLKKNASVIIISHLGRPEGKFEKKYSLKPVFNELRRVLTKAKGIGFAGECIGSKTKKIVDGMHPGNVLLLENLRFKKEEEENNSNFASELASYADYYINDAFGVSHRAHASVDAITQYLPCAAGLLLEKEIKELSKVINPKRPFVCVLGGAKITDKMKTIQRLAEKADKILIGGAMANSFMKAQGRNIGLSKAESAEVAAAILRKYFLKIVLPDDVIVADKLPNPASVNCVYADSVPPKSVILDIGPKTVERFAAEIKSAATIFWNGPMGYFEDSRFRNGTKKIAEAITSGSAVKIVGGGDSADAVAQLGLEHKFTHVSTGGGAALEFLEGKKLPAIAALERNYKKYAQSTP